MIFERHLEQLNNLDTGEATGLSSQVLNYELSSCISSEVSNDASSADASVREVAQISGAIAIGPVESAMLYHRRFMQI